MADDLHEAAPAIGEAETGAAAEAAPAVPAEEKIETETPPAGKPAAPTSAAKSGARDLPRLMTRIFGTPLMIAAPKLDVILSALGPRLGLAAAAKPDMLADLFDDGDDDDLPNCPYTITPDGIALISVDGTLVYKSSWLGALSGLTAYSEIGDALNQAIADPSVKGILLSVDSYGGEVNGCFDLSDAIHAAAAIKPLYAVAADDAYSAAYAIASAASKLYVSRTSGVGSVGVVALHVDQSAADKAEGLKYTYIYSGDRKVDGNPHQPLSNPALEAMQAECDRLRGMFAASVARYRGLSVDSVLAMQAACYFGEQAVAAKLADAVGTPADALSALRADLAKKAASPAQPTQAQRDSAEIAVLKTENAAVLAQQAAAEEIIELCTLAKRPDLAAQFIRSRTGIAVVREKLQMLRAEASDARKTSGHILPDAGTNDAQTVAAGWDLAVRKVCGSIRKD